MKTSRKRKIISIGVSVLLIVCLVCAPLLSVGAVDGNVFPKEGELHIHKVTFDTPQPGDPDPVIKGDGTEISSIPGGTPVDNVKFNVIMIKNESDVVENPTQKDALAYWTAHKDDSTYNPKSGKTNQFGVYDTGKIPTGRYLIFEVENDDTLPAHAMPLVITIPRTTEDGTGWNSDIHVYTKDVSILGAARLYKHKGEEGKSAPLAGAKFNLYSTGNGEDGGEGEEHKDVAIETNIVTDDSGYTPVISNLVKGRYYFVEAGAPDGYLLNAKKYYFDVGDTNHAYTPGGEIDPVKVINVGDSTDSASVPNYLAPTISKELTTKSTADVGEANTWTITSDIPANIQEYTYYEIKDKIDPNLDYLGNINVTINGNALNPAAYQVKTPQTNNGELSITLISSSFSGYLRAVTPSSKLVVKFDTAINNKAVPAVDIPNTAYLSFNNSYIEGSVNTPQKPYVTTGGRKFMKTNTSSQPLADATFVMYKMKDTTKLYLHQDSAGKAKWVTEFSEATQFTSPRDGAFKVVGLSYGDYYLHELKAPKGYNLLKDDVHFTIDSKSYEDGSIITVMNSDMPTIPVTGGIGTIIFLIIGGTIMFIVLFSNRKKKQDQAAH